MVLSEEEWVYPAEINIEKQSLGRICCCFFYYLKVFGDNDVQAK